MLKKFVYQQRNKHLLKRLMVTGRGRPVGRLVFNSAVGLELAAHRLAEGLSGMQDNDQGAMSRNLTVLVKTFERPEILTRLLSSFRRFHPQLKIIVVDDSRNPVRVPGTQTISMPFDSGVGAGRNEGLRHIETPYLLLLDDDFVLYRQTGLLAAFNLMEQEPRIDIMGGAVVDLPFYRVADYRNAGLFPTDAQPLKPPGSMLAGLPVYDKVPQFYIARTESIRKVGWDERLKRTDHADFFTRARGVLVSVYNQDLRCLHARSLFDDHYQAFRADRCDETYLADKYPTSC